ncbi:hypothetical protein Lfu02_79800 [Longispora fulva]|uniref:Uncharacterized protein n=1 Tax=Longispora fulva TaxID=619741 RepID=A0A8J7KZJ0_9ACTN|nr:hypothetical protein [Longispora fulva]GIG63608.1 hypothetical protein Lfu02_79800 [Longispora fulva]
MRWCVIRHPERPELGAAVIAECSLSLYEPLGWARVSDWSRDRDALRLADHPAPAPPAPPSRAAGRTPKEVK